LEAISLYKKLLKKYPQYQRNDQVLYQMSRAYEELGRVEEAMAVMDRLVRNFPHSRYLDEVQFRRAEYFFVRRKYLDAEDAYKAIVNIGVSSSFYQLALYKLGWTFYKQELYEEALDRFIALLDYKVSTGYDFAQTKDEIEHQRMEDTFRVISLSFSYLGGSEAVADYFSHHGRRSYEDGIYRNLGEYYFDKRRYSDAVATYRAFVSRNPFHKMSPHFLMRVIEINTAGGFPSLVIDSKKEFATKYGLKAEYWQHFDPKKFPEVLGYLKTNLKDLANHYHALYQDPKHAEEKEANFKEALHWYHDYLASFPKDTESPAINYQLADLLLENHSFGQAAVEFEKTAYDYPHHEKSSKAGYAAVYAYRQYLGTVQPKDKDRVKREVVRSSLKFADTFPKHEKAAVVLGAAADDLYDMKDYEPALAAARKLIKVFPGADPVVLRSAWLVVGHSTYELDRYSEAEAAYGQVLALLPTGDKTRSTLVDNLAASIYKQGEQAKAKGDFRAAANHFLRVGQKAPTSKIRPTAEYDAAAALIELKDWEKAATVLTGFRKAFPGNKLQPEVTKKIAYVYKEAGKLSLAAGEYERIERESKDEEVRREALTVAAELHEKAGEIAQALEVYQRYVKYFPKPVELNLEMRNKIAEILKARDDQKNYLDELRKIVAIDASAGSARTDRTRYLAAKAGLVLAEQKYDAFVKVKLVKPLKVNLARKRDLMKASTEAFSKLLDYEVGEVTAAATYYLAEIYGNFSTALNKSERPEGLSPAELEQYNLAIEDQAYPFEEKAIDIYEKNLQLISRGIYNEWIDKSLQKLAKLVPAQYDRPEESGGIVSSLNSYVFAFGRPSPPPAPAPEEKAPAAVVKSSATPGAQPGKTESRQGAEPAPPEKASSAQEVVQDKGPATPEPKAQKAEPAPPPQPAPEKKAPAVEVKSASPSVKTGKANPEQGAEPAQQEKQASIREGSQAKDSATPQKAIQETEPSSPPAPGIEEQSPPAEVKSPTPPAQTGKAEPAQATKPVTTEKAAQVEVRNSKTDPADGSDSTDQTDQANAKGEGQQ
ncbi:MAG: tetratricopeptide repeat protein, partial [Desulfuromonadales bacterium]